MQHQELKGQGIPQQGQSSQYIPTTQTVILLKRMQNISKADRACRGFSVTIVQDVLQKTLDELEENDSDLDDTIDVQRGVKRRIEDISEEYDSDGSDGTELPSAKRVKI